MDSDLTERTNRKTVAIIQARYASSRLPGKVMLPIDGEPMLVRVVERVRRASLLHQIVVATTTEAVDDQLVEVCMQRGVEFTRGSMFDVLDRYYQSALQVQAEVIVRITADCPLIDPHEIDRTVRAFHQSGADFAANRLPPPWKRTFPIGLDTEVCTFSALKQAWSEAHQPHEREHVMPYLYMNSPIYDSRHFVGFPQKPLAKGQFKVLYVNNEIDYGDIRLTVDTAEDLALVNEIYARFKGRDDFSWLEVVELLEREPHLRTLNASVPHKTVLDVDMRGKELQ